MKPRFRILLLTALFEAAAAPVRAASPEGAPGATAPAAAPQDSLTLTQVYVRLQSRNPRLVAAVANADAAQARVAAAGVPPDPQVQVGLMNYALPGFSASMPSSMAPAIQLMQMLPVPGKLGLAARAAAQTASMTRADARETWWEVRTRAAMAFYDLYAAERQIAVMQRTLRLLRDFRQVAQAMYVSGEGRQSDVLRADVEVARMDAELVRMQAMHSVAAAKLNGLLDQAAAEPLAGVALEDLPAQTPPADSLLAWSEQSRPMLERGRTAVERAGTASALARREIWPDFTAGLQYGQRPGESGTERMASLMLGFSVPLFASSRQLRMRDEAQAMASMARADLMDMRAEVRARIAEIAAELERDRTLIALYQSQILPESHATVQSALSSYRVGAVDFMTLLDAQMAGNRYEQEMYVLLADYGTAVAELEMTIGRQLPVTARLVTEAP